MKRVTMPTDPWDYDPVYDDPVPMPVNPPKIRDRRPLTPASARTPTEIIATRSFQGNLNASDLRYMAMALLQMQDELFEARERIRQLEARAK